MWTSNGLPRCTLHTTYAENSQVFEEVLQNFMESERDTAQDNGLELPTVYERLDDLQSTVISTSLRRTIERAVFEDQEVVLKKIKNPRTTRHELSILAEDSVLQR